jgi:Uma2 family endonuclease
MQPARRTLVTEEAYLERERQSLDKHELIQGEIVAMPGGSPKHNAIAMNLGRALGNRLAARRCLVFSSDQRIHVEATGLYTYADVSVVTERPRFHPKFPDNLVNPTVVFEVLSGSTEAYDRGAKFAHYRRIPSLAEYVLVAQDERRLDHYCRIETGQWLLTEYEGDATVAAFPALGCEIPLGEVYQNVDLLDPPDPEAAGSA